MTRRAFDVEALEDLAVVKQRDAGRHARRARDRRAAVAAVPRAAPADRSRRAARSQPGMPVITGTGPVGRIDKVYGDYADVDADQRSELVGRGRDPAHRRPRHPDGLGRADSYACTIEWLERSASPSAKVAGRRRGRDQRPRRELPAGPRRRQGHARSTATTACSRGSRSSRRSTCRACARSMVLLAPPPPPDPDAKTKKRSEPAFGRRGRCEDRRRSCSSRTSLCVIVARGVAAACPAPARRGARLGALTAAYLGLTARPRRRAGGRRLGRARLPRSISSRGTPPGLMRARARR